MEYVLALHSIFYGTVVLYAEWIRPKIYRPVMTGCYNVMIALWSCERWSTLPIKMRQLISQERVVSRQERRDVCSQTQGTFPVKVPDFISWKQGGSWKERYEAYSRRWVRSRCLFFISVDGVPTLCMKECRFPPWWGIPTWNYGIDSHCRKQIIKAK